MFPDNSNMPERRCPFSYQDSQPSDAPPNASHMQVLPLLHPPESHHARLDSFPAVQLGTHVEVKVETLAGLALVLARVKVNDVLDLGSAAVDDPVVAVKGRLVAEEGVEASSWGQFLRVAAERDELGATAAIPS